MLDMTEEGIIPKDKRFLRGEKHPNWKNGRTFHGQYMRLHIPEHPRANQNGWVYEHIVVMERQLGRYLVPGEVVHHKNGIKTDNRIENLELMNDTEHRRQYMKNVWATFRNR